MLIRITHPALSQSVVAAIDSAIATALTTTVNPKPVLDCAANPNYPASTKNDFFFIGTAGKIGGASGISVETGDSVYCLATNAGGTQAAVGSSFTISQTNIPGLTTVGLALAVIPTPAEASYVRLNADGSVTTLTATELKSALALPCEIQLAVSDMTTAITAGTNKISFRMPFAMNVTSVRAALDVAQASGNIFTVDINEAGASILSTKLTVDNTATTSTTATTPAVISDAALADDALISVDVDQIGNESAKGLTLVIKGTRA